MYGTDTRARAADEELIEFLTAISVVSRLWQENLRYLPIRVNTRKEEKLMSKMGDMAATIEELRNTASAINDASVLQQALIEQLGIEKKR